MALPSPNPFKPGAGRVPPELAGRDDLVSRLGKSRTSDLSVSRNELIKAGHIFPVDRGFVAFTVPGMADFIHRRIGD
jgi:hypothetical protein